MRSRTRPGAAAILAAALWACGDGSGPADAATEEPEAESGDVGDAPDRAEAPDEAAPEGGDEAHGEIGPDAPVDEPGAEPLDELGAEDAPLDDPGADEAEARDAGPLRAIALPQAVQGAMWANPAVYDEIPLHVAVEGTADSVSVTVGGATAAAADPDGDGDWIARVAIGDLPEGFVDVAATAEQAGHEPVTATAELGLGTQGVQFTSFVEVGMAGVPRIHRVGDEAWVTWTDRSAGDAEAWLRKIDGAGRWTTERVALVSAEEETLYARTAVGETAIGILYQSPGSPYATHFKAVAFDGTELLAPVDLEAAGWHGSFGGDVAFDGSGFVATWRAYDDGGRSEVRWLRVVEGTWEVTGPVAVAASGPATEADPIGGFEPFSFIDVAVLGDLSLVGFVRGHYDELLGMEIPKSQLALVDADGTVEYGAYAGLETDFTFHRECRVFTVGGSFVAVWSASDLLDPSDNPPNLFYATRTDGDGALDPGRRAGTVMFDAVDDRDEPFLIATPAALGALAWLDHRAYTLDPARGRIELYAAPVGEDLRTGEEAVFPHARFVAGTSMLFAAAAGTNALLIWIDERHGMGIMDPKPEAYFETAWF